MQFWKVVQIMSGPGNNQIDRTQVVKRIQTLMQARPEILFAYLFGSLARGKAGALSDIDIAVYIDPDYKLTSKGYGYQSEMIDDLSKLLSAKVDLVILNRASLILKYQVISKGLLVLNRSNEQRRSFHEKTLREYLDFIPFLNVQREYLRKRLKKEATGVEQHG